MIDEDEERTPTYARTNEDRVQGDCVSIPPPHPPPQKAKSRCTSNEFLNEHDLLNIPVLPSFRTVHIKVCAVWEGTSVDITIYDVVVMGLLGVPFVPLADSSCFGIPPFIKDTVTRSSIHAPSCMRSHALALCAR